LLAKFRAQYEPVGTAAAPATAPVAKPKESAAVHAPAKPPAAKPAPAPAIGEPGLVQTAPVRSGQQVYAENRDLTIVTTVGAGAEVIADGSIHIYGALRGRALAGAQGNEKARIFCREFHAELVAIAGHYKVLEDIPQQLHGKAVQIWLEREQLTIAALD
jgi:septum site-determining protein MinC